MKILSVFALTIGLLGTTSSALAANECYTQEINPQTNNAYASVQEYHSDRQIWRNTMPENPNIFALAKAYSIYSSEKNTATKLGNDKRAHCYIGCRISQESGYRIAEYVGWLKEDRDIKDCNKNTHFDPIDFEATIKGAQLGDSQPDAESCALACQQNY